MGKGGCLGARLWVRWGMGVGRGAGGGRGGGKLGLWHLYTVRVRGDQHWLMRGRNSSWLARIHGQARSKKTAVQRA